MMFVLILSNVSLFMILLAVWMKLEAIMWRLRDKDEDHAKCIAHIAWYVGDSFAAQVLNVAADDYDSADEIHRKKVLAREFKDDGPSLPAIWMRDRADRLIHEESE